MLDFLRRLFDSSGFPARWNCGAGWSDTPALGWLHIISDLLIWGAYTAIPLVLVYFVSRRRDLPFPRVFWLFGAFIYSCGTAHLFEALIFWHPIYRFQGVLKLVTALVSWATVAALIPVIPKALMLPGQAKVNEQLAAEVARRQQAEEELRAKAEELQATNAQLDRFNRLAVGREERMIELKREANRLAERLGLTPPHNLDFVESAGASGNGGGAGGTGGTGGSGAPQV
ncbi:MAG: hypothetical protein NTW19_09855 [Planctomycetota bacterium]|nr:hypothetical protein [Planctomycetota bacterium]